MAHFAFICVPASGHIAPLAALARELKRRGHTATFLDHPECAPVINSFELDFLPLDLAGRTSFSLEDALKRASRVRGLIGIRPLIRDFAQRARMFCESLPSALQPLGIDAIVGDWIEPAIGLVAHHLGLPYVSIAAALPLNWAPGDTSPFIGWSHQSGRWHRRANVAVQWIAEQAQRPMVEVIQSYAERWGLPRQRRVQDWASGYAQIAQLTPSMDFPRRSLIGCFHYCGPLRDPSPARGSERRVQGHRRAFASLGSLQGHRGEIFEWIAAAAEALDLDLTIAHGGRLAPADAERLSRRAAVHDFVDYAQILSQSDVAIMHGGMNGVLDTLAQGVPLVVVPLAYEQGAIAARVRRAGAGTVCRPLARAGRLEAAIAAVMNDPSHAQAAAKVREEIVAAGGVLVAADIVEQVARTRGPCLNAAAISRDRSLASFALGADLQGLPT